MSRDKSSFESLRNKLIRKSFPLTIAEALDDILAVLREQLEDGRWDREIDFFKSVDDADNLNVKRLARWGSVARKAHRLYTIASVMAFGVHGKTDHRAIDDVRRIINDDR